MLLYKQVLASHPSKHLATNNEKAAPSRKILIYSCPTKNVLLRVGREFHAHRLIYWLASTQQNGQYMVRRPWAVRSKTGKQYKAAQSDGLVGGMDDLICYNMREGRERGDIGGGRPEVNEAQKEETKRDVGERRRIRVFVIGQSRTRLADGICMKYQDSLAFFLL